MRSKSPVLPSVWATIMPPNRSDSGPAAVFVASTRSDSLRIPSAIKALGAHKIKVHLHPEVTVDITALVARSPDEAEFLGKGGTLVAETERAALEAAEAAQRAAEQAAALFEAKPAAEGEAAAETEAPAEEAAAEKK